MSYLPKTRTAPASDQILILLRSDVLARHVQTHPLENAIQTSLTGTVNFDAAQQSSSSTVRNEPRRHLGKVGHEVRTNSFTTRNDGIYPPNHNQIFQFSPGALYPLQNHQGQLEPSILHPNPSTNLGQNKFNDSLSGDVSLEEDTAPAVQTLTSGGERILMDMDVDDGSQEEWHLSAPLLDLGTEVDLGLDCNMKDKATATGLLQGSPNTQTPTSQPSFWQIMHDQGSLVSPTARDELNHSFLGQASDQAAAHGSTVPATGHLPAMFQVPDLERYDLGSFLLDPDLGAYDYMSPGVLDYLDFATPRPPLESNNERSGKADSSDVLFSVNQMQRMRQLWRGRRKAPGIRVVRSLWQTVVQHGADNIFSKSIATDGGSAPPPSDAQKLSRWGVDNKCIERMTYFCKDLENKTSHEDLANLTPHSTPQTSGSEVGSESSPLGLSSDGFPTREVLDASLDLFFQCSHLPFIHKATFDAKTVPESLLLAIFLLGLSSLYPERSKPFVLRYLNVRIF